ncbi:hypothetical protein GCM10027072_64620 [Streptomyces bullii]
MLEQPTGVRPDKSITPALSDDIEPIPCHLTRDLAEHQHVRHLGRLVTLDGDDVVGGGMHEREEMPRLSEANVDRLSMGLGVKQGCDGRSALEAPGRLRRSR